MRLAIGVQGRFHAFHLAKALIEAGEDVVVFTNYPRRIAARWGLPPERVRSFVTHGVFARALAPIRRFNTDAIDSLVQRSFGSWLERELSGGSWEVAHLWSGVAEESLRHRPRLASRMFVMRGSAHIHLQDRLLKEEEARVGIALDRPSDWMIAREGREYAAADRVVVLSGFARASFIAEGFAPERLGRLPLAAPVEHYQPSEAIVRARIDRLGGGHPIRVLFVGALSAQKGLYDLCEAIRILPGDRFTWRLVGPRVPETAALLRGVPPSVDVLGKRPETELPRHYSWADAFVFPSLQDGFAVVLAQAAAAGLPIIASTNCGASEFVREGETGWIVPIRSPGVVADRLRWYDTHRAEAMTMVNNCVASVYQRSWGDVGRDFVSLCRSDSPLAATGAGASAE